MGKTKSKRRKIEAGELKESMYGKIGGIPLLIVDAKYSSLLILMY